MEVRKTTALFKRTAGDADTFDSLTQWTEIEIRMAARSRLLQRFFRRGEDGAVYFVLDPARSSTSEKCTHLLDRAAYHWRRGEYSEALEVTEAATKLDPESEEAYLMLACYALEAEQWNLLARLYERVPEEFARRMPLVALRAVATAATGDASLAYATLEQLASHHTKNSFFLFAKAEVYRLERRWGESADYFRQLYSHQGDFPYGHIHAAQVLILLNAHDEAIGLLDGRLRSQPRNAEIYHWLGVALESSGERSKALQAYRESLSIQPERHSTHYRLGRLEHHIGHDVAALQHLRIAFDGMPDVLPLRRELVAVLIKLQQWQEAARLFPEMLRQDPTREDAEMLLHLYDHTESQQELEATLKDALQLYPQRPWLWYVYGLIALKRGDHLDAQRALTESIRLEPSADAYVALARLHRVVGQTANAIECYSRALELNRKHIAAWTERCMLRLEANQPDQALADIAQAIELAPDVGQFYYLRARCLLALGKESQALEDLIAAVQRDPTCIDAWLLSSQLWRQRGEYAQAIYALKQVLSVMPDDVSAHIAMAETQLAIGRFNAARHHIQRVLELRPEQGEELFLHVGKSLEARHLYNRALELYEEALQHYPNSADLRFRCGYVALKSGALHICSRQVEELAALDPIRAATLRDVYAALSHARRER
ncbi:MAG: tetratricopeptide repeat protein [Chlorobiota bacterium]|nr:MAG: tetratricopeptide repeat protein [Chlorobiota bacterium]